MIIILDTEQALSEAEKELDRLRKELYETFEKMEKKTISDFSSVTSEECGLIEKISHILSDSSLRRVMSESELSAIKSELESGNYRIGKSFEKLNALYFRLNRILGQEKQKEAVLLEKIKADIGDEMYSDYESFFSDERFMNYIISEQGFTYGADSEEEKYVFYRSEIKAYKNEKTSRHKKSGKAEIKNAQDEKQQAECPDISSIKRLISVLKNIKELKAEVTETAESDENTQDEEGIDFKFDFMNSVFAAIKRFGNKRGGTINK